MMSWTLCLIMSSAKEPWEAVTTKVGPFHHNSWEGHMLGFIQSKVFLFHCIRADCRSPFTTIKSLTDMTDRVNHHAPVQANVEYDIEDPHTLFEFSIGFLRRLFKELKFSTVAIASSAIDIRSVVILHVQQKAY